jgi:hypothetical protein
MNLCQLGFVIGPWWVCRGRWSVIKPAGNGLKSNQRGTTDLCQLGFGAISTHAAAKAQCYCDKISGGWYEIKPAGAGRFGPVIISDWE